MDRIPKLSAVVASAAALAVAGAWAPAASAQITTGLPTGGSYAPYDSFAQNWYDPYDWYGRAGGTGGIEVGRGYGSYPAGGAAGPGAGAGVGAAAGAPGMGLGRGATEGYGRGGYRPRATVGNRAAARGGNLDGGLYEGPGALGEGGEQDYQAPPSRPVPYRGSPYFNRGYSPYYGYRDFDDDFYDDDFYGGYGVEESDELERGAVEAEIDPLDTPGAPGALDQPVTGLDADTELPATGADPRGADDLDASAELPAGGFAGGRPAVDRGVVGREAAPPGAIAIDAPGQIEESDELYEDYDSLYGGYGDYEYVEEGSDRYLPTRGLGPRYRNYYSEDWFDDAADFDDWYDSMEPLGREFAQPENREGISEVDDEDPEIEGVGVVPR